MLTNSRADVAQSFTRREMVGDGTPAWLLRGGRVNCATRFRAVNRGTWIPPTTPARTGLQGQRHVLSGIAIQ